MRARSGAARPIEACRTTLLRLPGVGVGEPPWRRSIVRAGNGLGNAVPASSCYWFVTASVVSPRIFWLHEGPSKHAGFNYNLCANKIVYACKA